MNYLPIHPRITVPFDALVGLVSDKTDARFGEIFSVGRLWFDEFDTRRFYIHHICPDGVHYSSAHFTPNSVIGDLNLKQAGISSTPRIFYIDERLPDHLRCSLNGDGLYGLFDTILRLDKNLIRKMQGDYRLLFGEDFPLDILEQIRTAPEITTSYAFELAA